MNKKSQAHIVGFIILGAVLLVGLGVITYKLGFNNGKEDLDYYKNQTALLEGKLEDKDMTLAGRQEEIGNLQVQLEALKNESQKDKNELDDCKSSNQELRDKINATQEGNLVIIPFLVWNIELSRPRVNHIFYVFVLSFILIIPINFVIKLIDFNIEDIKLKRFYNGFVFGFLLVWFVFLFVPEEVKSFVFVPSIILGIILGLVNAFVSEER